MSTPPPGVTIAERGRECTIRQRWLGLQHVAFLFVALFWLWFVGGFYPLILEQADVGVVGKLLPLVHVGIGVGLLYWALAGLVNVTRVEVGPGHVDVSIGPLPWPGSVSLAASDIQKIFCDETVRHGKHGRAIRRYHVVALLRDGDVAPLVRGLRRPDDAAYLGQLVERYLTK